MITCAASDAELRTATAKAADVIVAGAGRSTWRRRSTRWPTGACGRVLCEGGPHLLGDQVAAAGLLDELCLSVSPLLAGPGASRIIAGAAVASARPLTLAHVLDRRTASSSAATCAASQHARSGAAGAPSANGQPLPARPSARAKLLRQDLSVTLSIWIQRGPFDVTRSRRRCASPSGCGAQAAAGPSSDELTLAESSALSRLERGGPATSSDLARLDRISPQSMGVTVAALLEPRPDRAQPRPGGRQADRAVDHRGGAAHGA